MENGGAKKKSGLWRKMMLIRESMDSAAVFTIGVKKDNRFDILEVKAASPLDMSDFDEADEELGAKLPKPGRLNKGINYIG